MTSILINCGNSVTRNIRHIKKEGKAPLLTLDHYDVDVALDSERDSSKTKIRLMEEVLKEASNVARKKNIKFLVLIQPSVIDLTVDDF